MTIEVVVAWLSAEVETDVGVVIENDRFQEK